ncbi:MAG: MFS transporter [Streptosporangiaceae bacterium]
MYLPSLLDRAHVAEGNAKLQAGEAAAQAGGPGAVGLITHLAGAANALLADAASFFISAFCLLAIRARQPRLIGARQSSALGQEIAEGLRFVVRDPYLRVLALFSAVSNIGLFGYQSLLVVFLVREVGVSPGAVGVLAAAASLGGVLGAASASAAARRFGSARILPGRSPWSGHAP